MAKLKIKGAIKAKKIKIDKSSIDKINNNVAAALADAINYGVFMTYKGLSENVLPKFINIYNVEKTAIYRYLQQDNSLTERYKRVVLKKFKRKFKKSLSTLISVNAKTIGINRIIEKSKNNLLTVKIPNIIKDLGAIGENIVEAVGNLSAEKNVSFSHGTVSAGLVKYSKKKNLGNKRNRDIRHQPTTKGNLGAVIPIAAGATGFAARKAINNIIEGFNNIGSIKGDEDATSLGDTINLVSDILKEIAPHGNFIKLTGQGDAKNYVLLDSTAYGSRIVKSKENLRATNEEIKTMIKILLSLKKSEKRMASTNFKNISTKRAVRVLKVRDGIMNKINNSVGLQSASSKIISEVIEKLLYSKGKGAKRKALANLSNFVDRINEADREIIIEFEKILKEIIEMRNKLKKMISTIDVGIRQKKNDLYKFMLKEIMDSYGGANGKGITGSSKITITDKDETPVEIDLKGALLNIKNKILIDSNYDNLSPIKTLKAPKNARGSLEFVEKTFGVGGVASNENIPDDVKKRIEVEFQKFLNRVYDEINNPENFYTYLDAIMNPHRQFLEEFIIAIKEFIKIEFQRFFLIRINRYGKVLTKKGKTVNAVEIAKRFADKLSRTTISTGSGKTKEILKDAQKLSIKEDRFMEEFIDKVFKEENKKYVGREAKAGLIEGTSPSIHMKNFQFEKLNKSEIEKAMKNIKSLKKQTIVSKGSINKIIEVDKSKIKESKNITKEKKNAIKSAIAAVEAKKKSVESPFSNFEKDIATIETKIAGGVGESADAVIDSLGLPTGNLDDFSKEQQDEINRLYGLEELPEDLGSHEKFSKTHTLDTFDRIATENDDIGFSLSMNEDDVSVSSSYLEDSITSVELDPLEASVMKEEIMNTLFDLKEKNPKEYEKIRSLSIPEIMSYLNQENRSYLNLSSFSESSTKTTKNVSIKDLSFFVGIGEQITESISNTISKDSGSYTSIYNIVKSTISTEGFGEGKEVKYLNILTTFKETVDNLKTIIKTAIENGSIEKKQTFIKIEEIFSGTNISKTISEAKSSIINAMTGYIRDLKDILKDMNPSKIASLRNVTQTSLNIIIDMMKENGASSKDVSTIKKIFR